MEEQNTSKHSSYFFIPNIPLVVTVAVIAFFVVICALLATNGKSNGIQVVFESQSYSTEYKDKSVDMNAFEAAAAAGNVGEYHAQQMDWIDSMTCLEEGRADIFVGEDFTTWYPLPDGFSASDPYVEQIYCWFTTEDYPLESIDELNGKMVGTVYSSSGTKFAKKNASEYGYSVQTYKNAEDVWTALKSGAISAAILPKDYPSLADDDMYSIIDEAYTEKKCFIVRDSLDLLDAINEGIKKISEK